jgi:hypothetical protein
MNIDKVANQALSLKRTLLRLRLVGSLERGPSETASGVVCGYEA